MKVLVVDDERLARGRLIRMLARVPGIEVIGEADGGARALEMIAALSPDLVFLDIDMPGPGGDGLSVAETPGLPPIVFTTAHVQFAAEAFEVNAVDYLLKPVRQERLEQAIERVKLRAAVSHGHGGDENAARITVHEGGGARFVDGRRVEVFRAVDKYTEFVLDGREHLVRESLDALEARLGTAGFVRVHRSALVRRDAIVEINSEDGALSAKTAGGATVEVSRRAAPELRRHLGLRRPAR